MFEITLPQTSPLMTGFSQGVQAGSTLATLPGQLQAQQLSNKQAKQKAALLAKYPLLGLSAPAVQAAGAEQYLRSQPAAITPSTNVPGGTSGTAGAGAPAQNGSMTGLPASNVPSATPTTFASLTSPTGSLSDLDIANAMQASTQSTAAKNQAMAGYYTVRQRESAIRANTEAFQALPSLVKTNYMNEGYALKYPSVVLKEMIQDGTYDQIIKMQIPYTQYAKDQADTSVPQTMSPPQQHQAIAAARTQQQQQTMPATQTQVPQQNAPQQATATPNQPQQAISPPPAQQQQATSPQQPQAASPTLIPTGNELTQTQSLAVKESRGEKALSRMQSATAAQPGLNVLKQNYMGASQFAGPLGFMRYLKDRLIDKNNPDYQALLNYNAAVPTVINNIAAAQGIPKNTYAYKMLKDEYDISGLNKNPEAAQKTFETAAKLTNEEQRIAAMSPGNQQAAIKRDYQKNQEFLAQAQAPQNGISQPSMVQIKIPRGPNANRVVGG